MRLYLAHPATYRHQVRKWELEFESRHPEIELINPFYDGIEREKILALDEGKVTIEEYCNNPYNQNFPAYDISLINDSMTNGVLAICPPVTLDGVHLDPVMMIGTPHEMYAAKLAGKPLFVITGGLKNHLWFRYDNAIVFSTFSQFEQFISPIKIAFIGRMGDGKSTAAQYLVQNYGFTKYAFADKLKAICAEMYPDKFANGAKPRELLQFMGTDAFRKFDSEVWVNYLVRKIERENMSRIVVDDCRFVNEAEALRKLGFVIIRLENTSGQRNAAGINDAGTQLHRSELEISQIKPDYTIMAPSVETLKKLLQRQLGLGSDQA